jgi:hypothetical protein
MAGFWCAHRSEYFRKVRRVLVSRFNRADAFGNKVVSPMMVERAGQFVTVLGAAEQFQRSFPPCLRYERLGKSRFVRVHACTVTLRLNAVDCCEQAISLIDTPNELCRPFRSQSR